MRPNFNLLEDHKTKCGFYAPQMKILEFLIPESSFGEHNIGRHLIGNSMAMSLSNSQDDDSMMTGVIDSMIIG
jgi:hypothetical protein